MADLGSTSFSETDNSNNSAAPNGWPAGMNGSQVEPTGRAMMGALKRLYGKTNALYTTSGTTTAYTLTSTTAETAYYNGQLYSFVVNATCGATASLNIDGLDAANFRKFTNAGTWATLNAGDLLANQIVTARYNSSGSGTFDILSMSFSLQDIIAAIPAASVFARSYLAGLGTLNNTGTPNTKIDVKAGLCADDTNTQMLSLAATTLDCTTSGANGLDVGSLADSTWYHLFVIGKTDGTTALLASTSLASPTYPNGYTLKRRIASFKTDGSAHILGYTQVGDHFVLSAGVADASAIISTTASTTFTLGSVPSGINVEAIFSAATGAGAAVDFYIYSPLATSLTTLTAANMRGVVGTAGAGAAGQYRIMTDTAQHVMAIAGTNGSQGLSIFTTGWVDRRGRDD